MTTLHIHLTMAAVGVGVCLAFVGLVKYRHHSAFKRTLLGICAGGAVAVSPFLASLGGVASESLLPKSVLLSLAAVLSCILFYTLSQWPIKANVAARSIPRDTSRHAVVLSAENPNRDAESAAHDPLESDTAAPTLLRSDDVVEDFPTLELDEDTNSDPIYDVSDDDIFDAPDAMQTLDDSLDDSFDIDMAFADNTDATANAGDANAGDPNRPIAANDDANSDDVEIDNSLIFELTGQHEIPTDVGNPEAADNNVDEEFDEVASNDAIARSLDLDKALRNQLDELESTLRSLDAEPVEDVDTATEKLIALQRQVLDQNERQQQIIEALKEQSAAQRKQQEEETSRLRELVKNTAEITRHVAEQQRNLLEVAEQEKASRLKSEAAAKNALGIARQAISRLSMAKSTTRSPKS